MIELELEQKSVIVHTIAGVLVGALSGILGADPYQIGNGLIVLLMIALLVLTGQLVQRIFKLAEEKNEDGTKKYGFKWWMSNGGLLYLGFWLIVWIISYNRFLIS